MHACMMDGWMNGCVDVDDDGCMDECMDECMDGHNHSHGSEEGLSTWELL